ncbi:histidine kinase [Glycomyces sp. L485]|nr:histidine kinase [Glycomyces sp. L485]
MDRLRGQDFAGRFRFFTGSGSLVAGIIMILMALSTAIGFGAYLRGLDRLRRETQEEVRRAERMELAREMHDFVAHHVTGVVVLAQAAQVTDTGARPSPCPHDEPEGASLPSHALRSFADIEEAGLAALAPARARRARRGRRRVAAGRAEAGGRLGGRGVAADRGCARRVAKRPVTWSSQVTGRSTHWWQV